MCPNNFCVQLHLHLFHFKVVYFIIAETSSNIIRPKLPPGAISMMGNMPARPNEGNKLFEEMQARRRSRLMVGLIISGPKIIKDLIKDYQKATTSTIIVKNKASTIILNLKQKST